MSSEADFLRRLRAMVGDPAARGLLDDVALLPTSGEQLVLTSDTLVEGVHYLSGDPPETVGWKLAAVNLSDLAAKGAIPRACLLNYALSADADWDAAFLDGLGQALDRYAMPLIGGDTVALPAGAPRVLSLTAIGSVPAGRRVPDRAGARQGDRLYASGPVGDAGAGLELLHAGEDEPMPLIAAYRTPLPDLALGQALAPVAHAMMDISDGLLIDVRRMAEASGCAIAIDAIPLSADYAALHGLSVASRIAAATAGDDYVLLVALPPDVAPPEGLIAVGRCTKGSGLSVVLDGVPVDLPERLGYEHGPGQSASGDHP
jgi:thiamine-monophosphate kinase